MTVKESKEKIKNTKWTINLPMTVKEFKDFVANIDEKYDDEVIYYDIFNGEKEKIKSVDTFYSTTDVGLYLTIFPFTYLRSLS